MMPASSKGEEDEAASKSRFARPLPPTHIQKVGTRLELEVEAKADGGPVRAEFNYSSTLSA